MPYRASNTSENKHEPIPFFESSLTWVSSLCSWTIETPLLQIENMHLLSQTTFFHFQERKFKPISIFFSEMKKPIPSGIGFLLDVVPHRLTSTTLGIKLLAKLFPIIKKAIPLEIAFHN